MAKQFKASAVSPRSFQATHEIVDSDGMWVEDVMSHDNLYVNQEAWECGGRWTYLSEIQAMGWDVRSKTDSHS